MVNLADRSGAGGTDRLRHCATAGPGAGATVLVTPDDYDSVVRTGVALHGVWSFLLDPIDERTTRLIVRSLSGPKEEPGRFLVFDSIHFIMERQPGEASLVP